MINLILLVVATLVSANASPKAVTPLTKSLRYGIEQVTVVSSTVGPDLVASHSTIGFGHDMASDLQNELARKYSPCGENSELEVGDTVFDVSVKFSAIPLFGSEMVKENLVKVTDKALSAGQASDLAGATLREYLPSYSALLTASQQNALKNALGVIIGNEDTARRKIVNQIILAKQSKLYDERVKKLFLQTTFQQARVFVGKKISNGSCLLMQIGKYTFSSGAPTDENGDTELEKVMIADPYALSAVDTACTLGTDLSFLQSRATDDGFNKYSLYIFHNRTAYSTLSRFLGITMNQTEEQFKDDEDLFKVDSVLARAIFVREKYDVYASAGIFDGDFALAIGGSCHVAPGTKVYVGYSYNERKEMTSDDSRPSHSAYVYLVRDLGNDVFLKGDHVSIYGGLEGAMNAERPEETLIGHDFLACEVGANYKVPMKGNFLRRHMDVSLGAAVRIEERWRNTGNKFSDQDADAETVGLLKVFANLKFLGGSRR